MDSRPAGGLPRRVEREAVKWIAKIGSIGSVVCAAGATAFVLGMGPHSASHHQAVDLQQATRTTQPTVVVEGASAERPTTPVGTTIAGQRHASGTSIGVKSARVAHPGTGGSSPGPSSGGSGTTNTPGPSGPSHEEHFSNPLHVQYLGPSMEDHGRAADECVALLQGQARGGLTKQVVRTDGPGDVATLRITLTSGARAAAVDVARDCIFVDTNNNGRFDANETLVVYYNSGANFVGAGATASAYALTVSLDARPVDRICDRAQRVHQGAPATFDDRSELVCVVAPTVVVSESGNAALLPISAAVIVVGVLLGGMWWRRRQNTRAR